MTVDDFVKSKVLPEYRDIVTMLRQIMRDKKFIALNGGPHFKFTEAVSFVVNCKTQEEVGEFWAKLTKDGKEVECGWLRDKYGLSWQIVPAALGEMLQDKDPAKAKPVIEAMRQMKKIDIATLQRAYDQ